ncbi:HAD hydrolase-like protein, partial [Streptomyces sp. NPDC059152]|uniref:HAD hydrolase-like protein n=1 Tax=Streptomyces sp. NPDC059152 TaxID=3346742 RepID=UPI00367A055E
RGGGVGARARGGAPPAAGPPPPPSPGARVRRRGARRPLVVGDRLDTDIEGAWNGGVDSLLVLTGVTTPAALLAAPPEHRPTYVDADLRGLLRPQPEVAADGTGFGCGGWRAEAAGDELVLDGAGEPLDGLRALCAAAWTAAGAGSCPADAAKALRRLGM